MPPPGPPLRSPKDAADIKRIHAQLRIQGLHCLDHIKDDFPSFFSFRLRVIPFPDFEDATVRAPRRPTPPPASRH